MTKEELKQMLNLIISKCDNLINNNLYTADDFVQCNVEDIAEMCNMALDEKFGELPSLPSNLEKAAEEYAFINWEDNDYHESANEGVPFDPIGYTEKVFKAGTEWMSNQLKKKEMNKNYTTIEQSKKLVELGLNPDTADMVYEYNFLWKSNDSTPKAVNGNLHDTTLKNIPCWSLGALLELISNYIVYHIGNNKIHITFYNAPKITSIPTYVTTDYDYVIDAAFEMVCWLLKNSYIKKGE